MAQHNVKIEEKLYAKLKAYCDLNHETIFKICNDAIRDYLNNIQYGDAPFMTEPVVAVSDTLDKIDNAQTSEISENMVKEPVEKQDTTIETATKEDVGSVTAIPSKKADEIITEFLSNNTDEKVRSDKVNDTINETTPQRPRKRRL